MSFNTASTATNQESPNLLKQCISILDQFEQQSNRNPQQQQDLPPPLLYTPLTSPDLTLLRLLTSTKNIQQQHQLNILPKYNHNELLLNNALLLTHQQLIIPHETTITTHSSSLVQPLSSQNKQEFMTKLIESLICLYSNKNNTKCDVHNNMILERSGELSRSDWNELMSRVNIDYKQKLTMEFVTQCVLQYCSKSDALIESIVYDQLNGIMKMSCECGSDEEFLVVDKFVDVIVSEFGKWKRMEIEAFENELELMFGLDESRERSRIEEMLYRKFINRFIR
eukprot:CAMPEP_0182443190 /NCGR_PEP_ID=MMETSP1172-20130603/1981_1 /TAXON_ID=708627 /ORGANISM="Timspurckia oligopyrenoides, Strain CCMP3278" /LENGTH=281 /DNA_ID=CAMNT_0024638375 /DNA_START=189 /DNA_END=1031 /DNA_ORIENTATION=+